MCDWQHIPGKCYHRVINKSIDTRHIESNNTEVHIYYARLCGDNNPRISIS